MKVIDIAQNTARWHQERMIRPTASEFDRIITYSGKPSDQRKRYMYELIFQRIYRVYACPPLETPAMTRGKALEAKALQRFCDATGQEAWPGKFLITDDGKVGCSPDGVITMGWEGVEIKVPDGWRHMMYSTEGPLKDYKPQMQGLMYVGEFARMHFFSYHPGMPCVPHVIERDEPYIETLAGLLEEFVAELDAKEREVRALGNFAKIDAYLEADAV